MFHAPWAPAAGVGRTPDRDRGRTDSRRKMHRSGIISDIQPSAANEFRKFGKCQAQQNDGSFNVMCNQTRERFFPRTRSNDNGESELRQTTSDLAESSCIPSLGLHDRARVNHDVWTALHFFLNANGFCGMRFVAKSRRALAPQTKPLKTGHSRLYGMC